MFTLTVELFGLPANLISLRTVRVTLDTGAGIPELVSALRREIPAMEGTVIPPGKNRLIEGYAFNINGSFYTGKEKVRLKDSDTVRLLALATGG